MLDLEILQQEVTPWVEQALEKENIKNMHVKVTGKSEKGEGYAGEVVFVNVTGSTKLNGNIDLDLVLKMGKRNKMMREKFSIGDIYLREVLVYDKIFPAFKKFQQETKLKKVFDAIPKCFSTLVLEDVEIVILENLKKSGYQLNDREIPMNTAHIKLILDNYAKFHATSFAMRDQNKEEFDKLTVNYICLQRKIFLQDDMKQFYDIRMVKMTELVKENDPDLFSLFLTVFERGLSQMLSDVLSTDVKECVITHGDCWNNNFMFKYQNDDLKNPTRVAILDWQLSCVHSPVLDLSYFLYIVSSKEQVSQFDDYLKFYYSKLAEYLQEMGSNCEKLFPFSTLMEHFNKYSVYGIVFVISSLEMMLCSKDDAISFDDVEDMEEAMKTWTENIKPKNEDSYRERVLATIRHFCENAIKSGH